MIAQSSHPKVRLLFVALTTSLVPVNSGINTILTAAPTAMLAIVESCGTLGGGGLERDPKSFRGIYAFRSEQDLPAMHDGGVVCGKRSLAYKGGMRTRHVAAPKDQSSNVLRSRIRDSVFR